MTYKPYLISNYTQGLDRELQPWLIADDSFVDLIDGFVVHGVIRKRNAYKYFATGERNDAPYCESRIVSNIASLAMTGVIDSANTTYTTTAAETPIRRGTFVVTSSTPSQTATDDGVGGFTGDVSAGSIDYDSGAVSVTFNAAPTAGTVTYTYDYHPDQPVMGLMTFVTATNIKELFPLSTRRINKYDSTNNRLIYIGHTGAITAITTASPAQVTSVAHNLVTGDRIYIYGVVPDASAELNYTEFTITYVDADNFTIGAAYTDTYASGGTWQQIYSGGNSNFWSWDNIPNALDQPRLIFTNNVDQIQVYDPAHSPTVVDYVKYTGFNITTITDLKCLHVKFHKDRVLLFRTTEDGTIYPNRIRISGTGSSTDDFRTSATGAGFIDIPDGSWITGVQANRDDLIILTEGSTWVLKATNNDTTPFILQQMDESRGCRAPFSPITYLNRTMAAGARNLIVTDGYSLDRMDDKIPDYTLDNIDLENFSLCFSGQVDDEHQWVMAHPSPDQDESDKILVTNYEEDTFSVYDIPVSCFGLYQLAFDITWDDLDIYDNWSELGAAYANWNSFAYSSGSPFTVAGGHHGEVWSFNITEGDDNPQKIRNIVLDAGGATLTVTTDWNNYAVGDYIYFTDVSGMIELNNKQPQIISVTDNYTFVVELNTTGFSAYTSGGTAARVIPFSLLTKKFNPWAGMDKKVKCGWLYMYVNTSGTALTEEFLITDATQADPCVITTLVDHGLSDGQTIRIFNVSGMTELNEQNYQVTVLSDTTFSIDVDSSAFTAYTSGGYVSVPVPCKIDIDIIVNDTEQNTQLANGESYEGNCTNLIAEVGQKKWYKLWINQTGRFIQFRMRNSQAGTNIAIHAQMPGFQPVGRLI